jgi:hypothetical protein
MARKSTKSEDDVVDEKKPEPAQSETDKGDKGDKGGKVEAKLESSEMETQPLSIPAAADEKKEKDLPKIEPPPPKGEPWPDATPEPMRPVESPARVRTETVTMPTLANVGTPPEMPKTAAPPPLALGEIENPAHMPGPREVPSGNPDDPAPAPGVVPRGDSRSLRRGNEFALIYRLGTYVISRFGTVGKRGQWRVVEYPTSSAASHSYAKECSRFVSEGFVDYRE